MPDRGETTSVASESESEPQSLLADEDSSSAAARNRNGSMALPREHSYLEESHPLLPDSDCYRTGNAAISSSNKNNNNKLELAVLELHGVVLFPDCTIPVKLQNRSLIEYIGKQIKLCRNDPVAQPRVLIGILPCYRESSDSHSVVGGGVNSNHLSQQPASANSRRRSWMRQRFSFGNRDIAPSASSFRLRQSLTAMRDDFLDSNSNSDSDSDSDSNTDSVSNESRVPLHSQPRPSHPLVGRIGTIATVQHTHERTTTSRRRRRRSNSSGDNNTNNSNGSDPFSVWGNYEEATELVFTAVGTSRFRILSCINDQQNIYEVEELFEASLCRPPFSSRLLPFRGHCKKEASATTPKPTTTTTTTITARSTRLPSGTNRMAWNLSQLTPLPYCLYQQKMPWSLVEKITIALKTNEWRGNLPSLGDESIVTNRSKLEPRAFSYWMANNAPFSEREKLKLLKMDSVLERLLFVWKAIEKLTSTQSELCCGLCGKPLAFVSEIFCVGGAEGTTAAYVNGHGFIHQITTLRNVLNDNNVVSFRDFPSTENSYFPGYSWWITCCSVCGSMLGWKFQKVATTNYHKRQQESEEDQHNNNNNTNNIYESDSDNEKDSGSNSNDGTSRTKHAAIDRDTLQRPPYFYGFMSSNVKVSSHRPTERETSQ